MGDLGSPPTVTEGSCLTLSDLFSMFDLLELGSSYSVSKGLSCRGGWAYPRLNFGEVGASVGLDELYRGEDEA